MPNVNNLYLTIENGKIAAYPGSRGALGPLSKFYTTKYRHTLTLNAAADGHQVGLEKQGNLHHLIELVNPSDRNTKPGATMWSVFNIDRENELFINDGSIVPSRKWVVYQEADGTYYVALWDGVTKLRRKVEEVAIVVKKTKSPY